MINNDEFLITYRLVDGSYVIAEEVDMNEEAGVIYVISPLELIRSSEGVKLIPWIVGEDDVAIELNANNIIARSETTEMVSKYYYKYIAYNNIMKALLAKEDDESYNSNNDQVDNLDSLDSFFSKLEKPNRLDYN
jgi:hypothetical protein